MMSDHQKETEFLRWCIRYDDSAERHKLEERITELQGNETCVRRAVWLMALLAALAMAGLCYSAVFLEEFPMNVPQFSGQFVIKTLCVLGIGSLICMLSFVGLGVVYRKELDQRREECRRLATKLLESRLGSLCALPLLVVAKDREDLANEIEEVVSALERVKPSEPAETADLRTGDAPAERGNAETSRRDS